MAGFQHSVTQRNVTQGNVAAVPQLAAIPQCFAAPKRLAYFLRNEPRRSPDSGKAIIFLAKAKFFGQKPAGKNEEKIYLLNEKTEFILSSEIKSPKSGICTNNYWVG